MIITISRDRFANQRDVVIIRDPTPQEFDASRGVARRGELRAIIDATRGLFIWEASLAVHFQVISLLALDDPVRLLISGDVVHIGWGRRLPPDRETLDKAIARTISHPILRAIYPDGIRISYQQPPGQHD